MIRSYAYDPRVWPALVTVASVIVLGWYGWRQRRVPAARPFAIGCLFAMLWASGTVLEILAVDSSTKVFWIKFQVAWQLPAVTAFTCFILTYVGFGRWLTKRNLALLCIPPVSFLVLIMTNSLHHLVWTGFQINGDIIQSPGDGNWAFLGYGYILGLVNILAMMWLAARSRRQRRPVAIMLFGQITTRGVFLLHYVYGSSLGPGEVVLVVLGIQALSYGLALFSFHLLDPVSAARTAVIEQMSEGMLVLDLQGRIADLNPTAARMLGRTSDSLRERDASEMLPANSGILAQADKAAIVQCEASLGAGNAARHYSLDLTPLRDRRGELLGQLLLMHDVTGHKRAQAQVLEQHRVVATLQERERLARELHDGIGQVLGFVVMQAQAIRKWVRDGDDEKAESLLGRLAQIASDAHADVRESILNLRTGPAQQWSFVPALRQHLDSFQANYGIRTELSLSDAIGERTFDPATEVQLLRVIQEAMTNARKHGSAHTLGVAVGRDGTQTRITIADDGCGFDIGRSEQDAGGHYGLVLMRERMAEMGGSLRIDSRPGAGTVISLDVPTRNRPEETE